MKKSICLAACLLAFNLTPVWGQDIKTIDVTKGLPIAPVKVDKLTKFNLDFPGGTPKELVAAIEKATGKPINVIIADEDAPTQLPPLKLNDITFPQLSDTLRVGSTKIADVQVRDYSHGGIISTRGVELGYYFKTTDERPTDNSVWFFRVAKKPEELPQPPEGKFCQFYSLSPYLDRGFTVDDISTAIQTGWKMAGVNPTPELNYHKETKLLIAYGEPTKLRTIDDVLKTLPESNMIRPGGKTYWDAIQDLQGQINELKRKSNIQSSSSNAAPVEKSGK